MHLLPMIAFTRDGNINKLTGNKRIIIYCHEKRAVITTRNNQDYSPLFSVRITHNFIMF